MKKSLLILSSLLALSLIGCEETRYPSDNSSGNDSSLVQEGKIAFAVTSLTLIVGDEYKLDYSKDTVITDYVFLSSTNPDVAYMDDHGYIHTGIVGTAIISADMGDLHAECEVTVTLGNYIPRIEFNYCDKSNLSLQVGDTYDLSCHVICNNEKHDFVPEYSFVGNENVLAINEGVITANKKGSDTVIVSGEYGGYSLAPISVTVDVIDSVNIVMKQEGIETNQINLSTIDNFDNKSYLTSCIPTFEIVDNNEKISNFEVDVINNDGVVTYEKTTGKITANKAGNCAFNVSYTNRYSELVSKVFPIIVNRPTKTIDDITFEVDLTKGTINTNQLFEGVGENTIISATTIDGSKEFTVEDGQIKDLDYNDNVSYKIIVFNDLIGAVIDIQVFSLIITEASDLAYFHCNDYGSSIADAAKVQFAGTYILGNDIDATSYIHKSHCRFCGESCLERKNTGLVGTFDGRGHTIDGITLGDGGLFGRISTNGVVKNVGFTNVVFDNADNVYTDEWVLATYIYSATIQDVYISIPSANRPNGSTHNTNVAGLAHDIHTSSIIKNMVIEVGEMNDEVTSYGSLLSFFTSKNNIPADFMRNVYVVSPYVLCKSDAAKDGEIIIDAGNRALETGATVVFNNVKRYDTKDDMNSALNDYSEFNSTYWSWNKDTGEFNFKSSIAK